MSQTLMHGTVSADRGPSGPVGWISPGDDLWIASRSGAAGVRLLGFVERSLDAFVAVDGEGASVGRHADLESAKRAVLTADEPRAASHWSSTGAPVLSATALRER